MAREPGSSRFRVSVRSLSSGRASRTRWHRLELAAHRARSDFASRHTSGLMRSNKRARLDRIANQCHHDRNLMRCLPGGEGRRREPNHDQVHLKSYQFLGQSRKPACLPHVRSELVTNIFSFGVAELTHVLLKEPPKALRG